MLASSGEGRWMRVLLIPRILHEVVIVRHVGGLTYCSAAIAQMTGERDIVVFVSWEEVQKLLKLTQFYKAVKCNRGCGCGSSLIGSEVYRSAFFFRPHCLVKRQQQFHAVATTQTPPASLDQVTLSRWAAI